MIAFTPFKSEQIIIGGQTGFGAFPKYSIQSDINSTQSSGEILNHKYTITISGKFVVDSAIDILESGARQSKYNTMIAQRVNYLKSRQGAVGKLEISPYGGRPGKIIYNDARLLSVNIPESTDESASILYSDYTLTFEAYIDASIGDEVTISNFNYNKYLLSNVEETWSIEKDEMQFFEGSSILSLPKHGYIITHTLSATGIRKANSSGAEFLSEAWKEAEKWVSSRVSSYPSVIKKGILGEEPIPNEFNPLLFDDLTAKNIPDLDFDGYDSFNHVRSPSVNIAEGSYSVTETWFMAKSPASIDIEANIDIDQNDVVTISVSGTITGHNKSGVTSSNNNKISQAEEVFNIIKGSLFDYATSEYSKSGFSGNLQSIVRSSSVGKNKTAGTITFNYSYSDTPVLISGAKNSSISINYDNDGHQTEVIAIIPVIARQGGPIIQKMKTSKERRRSAQLDVVMNRENRTNKPSGYSVLASYAPQGPNVTIQNFVENWEPLSGNYSLNVEWVY